MIGLFLLFITMMSLHANEEQPTTEDEYLAWAKKTWDSINRQNGTIKLNSAGAILNIPQSFYYLDQKDAKTVLVDIWGNPPDQTTLGMIFPVAMTPFDADAWAVTLSYEEDGYVSDDDADDIDYNELLQQMKKDTQESSKIRISQGYEGIELVGWASPPYYDANAHKLHWAKELSFSGREVNTLNYNIRVLGRKGVLVLNFIAGMDQKELIESKLDSVLALAEFDSGSKYDDFNPDIDKVAAYGIGALVAGKVIAKTGLFALALVFLKKFGVFIVVGLGLIEDG